MSIKSKQINSNIVNISYSSGNCVTCRYYDPKYHDGYCDKHRCDTNPGSTCRDYWAK